MTDDPQAARDALLLTVARMALHGPPLQWENFRKQLASVEALAAPRPPQEAPTPMDPLGDGSYRGPDERASAAASDDEAEVREWAARIATGSFPDMTLEDARHHAAQSWAEGVASMDIREARAALAHHRELTAGLREENARLKTNVAGYVRRLQGLAALEAQPGRDA